MAWLSASTVSAVPSATGRAARVISTALPMTSPAPRQQPSSACTSAGTGAGGGSSAQAAPADASNKTLNPDTRMTYSTPVALHTPSSLPDGSVKWKRRPPGKLKIGAVIVPPALTTLSSMASRSWA